jgi:hypothetical protein
MDRRTLGIGLAWLLLLPTPVLAGDGDGILKALFDDDGWTRLKRRDRGGVAVYRKDLPGHDQAAYRGVKVMDVDPDVLCDAIFDVGNYKGLSDKIPLKASEVIAKTRTTVDFWQFLDVPSWSMAKDRFWFARLTVQRDVGGQEGRHRQSWRIIDAEQHPEHLAKARAINANAILAPLNYGGWDIRPLPDGRVELTFVVLSDPGGRLPKSAERLSTARTLPENLLQFEAEAKRRQGHGGGSPPTAAAPEAPEEP